MFTILCLCSWIRNLNTCIFQNKSISSSFKWASEYILSILCWGTFNHYKSVHHLIPTLPVGLGNTPAIFRTNQKVPRRYVLFWVIREEEKKVFLQGGRRGTTLWDYPQEHLVVIRDEKVSPFAKFEIFLPLLCFLLDTLTNKHWRTSSSMINLWIDSRTCEK